MQMGKKANDKKIFFAGGVFIETVHCIATSLELISS